MPSRSNRITGTDDAIELQATDIHLDSLSDNGSSSDNVQETEDTSLRRPRLKRKKVSRYTAVEEKTVLTKLDKHLVLFLGLLYMLSFLDRSNIGNAKIAGLTDDLHLSSDQYESVLTAFYITYILFEWMTLLYHVVPPHIYISLCVASWGLIASFQCLAISFPSLLTLRALLGISEAAFGPGVPFYLSFFYNREELAFRTGLFISAAPLATSFAGSLAWLIVRIGTYSPIAPWRLLFLVEGFPSVIVAFLAWSHIPDTPATAKFLDPRQRMIAQMRLENQAVKTHKLHTRPRLDWRAIRQTLIDPKGYITAIMFFSCNVAFSSLPPFLPTIIRDMHYTALTSEALTAPPYLFAFVVVIFTTWSSDKRKARAPYLMFHALLGASGYAWLAISGYLKWPSIIRYAGTFAAAAGFFSAVALTITWTMDNRHAAEGKGTGVALLNIVGQLGALVGTRLYPDDDAPYYVKGMCICAGFMFVVAGLTLLLRSILRRENEQIKLDTSYQIVTDGEDMDEARLPISIPPLTQGKMLNIL